MKTLLLPQADALLKSASIGSKAPRAVPRDDVRDLMLKTAMESVDKDAFMVADLGELTRQHDRWISNLPRVEPFYAVKCNPDDRVIETMVKLGVGFDCASRAELQQIIACGVDPTKIIYANPCKQASHIRFAKENNVCKMTFDNADELFKIKQHFPDAELVLRILTDDSRSVCKLGTKFGASQSNCSELLQLARNLELNIVGVSFHVGSGCFDAGAFREAVVAARQTFDVAEQLGFNMQLLDVGGGFPGNQPGKVTFEDIAKVLGPALDEMFPNTRVIAEPGRFYVSSAFQLAVSCTARRIVTNDMGFTSYMYYVNEGVYGVLNCCIYDHYTPEAQVLMQDKPCLTDGPLFNCSLWGPTCDSIDCINKDCMLPELQIGDWLLFKHMGAYTICAASTFNGFKRTEVLYTTNNQ